MNCTIYLFGNLGQGLTLYPNDYTKDIFKEFISKASAPTQLIIHRDGTIMNYGYIRKIENDHLFGICVQINGQLVTAIKNLFEVFEDIITNIVVRGDILQLNKQGNIISATSNFTDKPQEVDRIIAYSQTELANLSSYCQTLPDIDYSSSYNDISNFKDSDNNQNIVNSSAKNGYTFVFKANDYDTLALNGYRSTLYSLNKENEANKRNISELNKELSVLKRQKKQMNVVVCLILILFIGSIVFYNTLDAKNKDIQSKQETIEIQSSANDKLTEENKELQNEQLSLETSYNSLIKGHNALREEHNSLITRYNSLTRKCKELESTVESKQSKINELQIENNSLELRCNNYSRTISRKDNDYSTLKNKYEKLNDSYDILSKKYYSTKEGKKESKRTK